MDNVIAEYQKWKQQGESLRTQARQAMETRFKDLLTEAARLAQEYHRDFGGALKPPPPITAFRFKAAGAKAAKKSKVPPAKAAAAPDPALEKKIAALEKRLAQTRSKLDAAKTAGKPTKNFEDRIYEIEDEIRLATAAS
jgi:phage shock protein A